MQVGRDWCWQSGNLLPHGQMITVNKAPSAGSPSPFDGEYELALLGDFQLENAAVAIASADTLHNLGYEWATPEALRTALRSVYWPGRLEVLNWEPPIVLDCAHNPYSMQKLVESLTKWFPGKRWVIIYGASRDKDIKGMLSALIPVTKHIIVTRSYHPRACVPSALVELCAGLSIEAEIAVDPQHALDQVNPYLDVNTGVLTTGSIFVVADAREAWAKNHKLDIPMGDWVDEPW